MDDFEAWWHHEAIFIDKGMFEDNMKFAKRLCEIAWKISAQTNRADCLKQPDRLVDYEYDGGTK